MAYYQYHGAHRPGTMHTYTHHGPVAHVTNRTNQMLNSSIVIGILNQSRMAKQAPNHAHLNIEFRGGHEAPELVVTRSGGMGPPRQQHFGPPPPHRGGWHPHQSGYGRR
ncbi:hypothetical protein GJ744_006785 [Endocarpon pusillum]|uniref:Uncharacterized protein n=1 Tax=Endocarpon pusillum TaxID=364733 RepID=A0A8H7AMU5_9EURO|nr:hypothetical protein GJ744_006785 [Endocarpon pusillum]